MIMLRWLFRMLPLVGLMVIATSFVRVISIGEVLSAWSAEIDEQEEIYMAGQGDCSAEDIIRGLCMYGRVIYKYNLALLQS